MYGADRSPGLPGAFDRRPPASKILVSFDRGMRPNKLGEVFPAQLTSFVWENTFRDFSRESIFTFFLIFCSHSFMSCSNMYKRGVQKAMYNFAHGRAQVGGLQRFFAVCPGSGSYAHRDASPSVRVCRGAQQPPWQYGLNSHSFSKDMD